MLSAAHPEKYTSHTAQIKASRKKSSGGSFETTSISHFLHFLQQMERKKEIEKGMLYFFH